MTDWVIDLDAPRTGPAGRTRRGRRPFAAGLAVLVGVLVVLTGPYSAPTLRLSWRIAATTPYSWLTRDALFTIDAGNQIRLTAHDLRSGRAIWSMALAGPLATAYQPGATRLATRFPPRLEDSTRTYVESTVIGQTPLVYPSVAVPLVQLTTDVALLIDRDPTVPPRSDATPAEISAGLDRAYRVTALDLRTGAVRWSRDLPAGVRWSLAGVRPGSQGLVGLPPGQAFMVTSTASGRVESWNLENGTLVARRELGPLEPESYVLALSDAVLVRHRGPAGPTAELLDPATLAVRHRFVPTLPEAEPLSCEPAICLIADGGTVLMEPDAGTVVARITGTILVPGATGRLLVTGYGQPLSIVDTNNGESSTESSWTLVDASTYVNQAVVARGSTVAGTATLGLLDPITGRVRVIAEAFPWTVGSHCQASRDHIACTDGRTLDVWAA
jgi:hypothetical protein